MNFEYRHLLPGDFSSDSKAWIYQSSRSFDENEALQIEKALREFVSGWKSHGVPVKGYGQLFFDQFVVILADENATGVSGCSIDSSARIIQQMEQQFQVEMFNWQSLAFIVNDKVQIISRQQFNYALEHNLITTETLFFNNTVATKKELEEKWIIPVSESWLKSKITTSVS